MGYRFEFYSLNLRPEQSGFVGEVADPSPGEVLTILHELGHAIADGRRRGFYRPLLGPVVRLNTSIVTGRRMMKALETDPYNPTLLEALQAARAANTAALAELTSLGVSVDHSQLITDWLSSTRQVENHAASLLKGREPVTRYAGTDAAEAFAELFAYSKADPAAMRRAYPNVAEWILSGAYLEIIDQEPLPAGVP